jgi:Putative glutamine amidotransferase
MRVLLAGESWVTHSIHVKGVDSFNTSTYTEGADRLREALAVAQIEVEYLPGHLVPARFPPPPPSWPITARSSGATSARTACCWPPTPSSARPPPRTGSP